MAAGSGFGNLFRVTTWGESHGKGIGVVVDGCPAGLSLCEDDIQIYLNRRKPGTSRFTTPRKEDDEVEILSGVFEGKTTGTPISMVVFNKTQRSKDYSEIASYYRPGHADYTYDCKYGFRDYTGGGRSSGRETIGRVAAGAIAAKLLKEMGITVEAYTKSIGPAKTPEEIERYLEQCMEKQDSAGGIIECVIKGMPAGIGEPCFEKLSANLGKAILSIGAVKGFEIGDGFLVAESTGLSNNDAFYYNNEGKVVKKTNHAGGILGGLSDGSDIVFRAAVKPTPSIFAAQETIHKSGENISINIKGRHDPVIVPRAIVVVECMAAITVLDALLMNMSAKVDNLKKFYEV
ncbi:MAG: chorismate synthase [Lachnospiraceae bacterium]|nr:chorismate synthase [Lachnospiraceae bacterium]